MLNLVVVSALIALIIYFSSIFNEKDKEITSLSSQNKELEYQIQSLTKNHSENLEESLKICKQNFEVISNHLTNLENEFNNSFEKLNKTKRVIIEVKNVCHSEEVREVKKPYEFKQYSNKGKFIIGGGLGYGTIGSKIERHGNTVVGTNKVGLYPLAYGDYFYAHNKTVGVEVNNNSSFAVRFGFLFNFFGE